MSAVLRIHRLVFHPDRSHMQMSVQPRYKLTFSEEPGPPFEPRQTSRLPELFRQRLA